MIDLQAGRLRTISLDRLYGFALDIWEELAENCLPAHVQ